MFLMVKCWIQSVRDHCSGESLKLAGGSPEGLRCWPGAVQPRRKAQPVWTGSVAGWDLAVLESEWQLGDSLLCQCESLPLRSPPGSLLPDIEGFTFFTEEKDSEFLKGMLEEVGGLGCPPA